MTSRACFASALVMVAMLLCASTSSAQTCNASVSFQTVATGFSSPVDIRHAKDSRLFIVEQGGRIRIIAGGAVLPAPFLDISGVVATGGERGLLSLAFHPNYPATPWFFVYYTNKDPAAGSVGDIVLARYSVSADPSIADPGSRRVLLVVPHSAAANHNGGQLHFGPTDGYLYVSIGDGGAACDTSGVGCNAQRDDSLLGKLLRIDVNLDVMPFYSIPPTNPFAAPGLPLDEIWAKGLRNPYRFSFDRATRDLYIGDVGQDSREEIDFQPASAPGGRNYGWKVLEGSLCGTCSTSGCPVSIPACNDPSLTPPLHEYGRTIGIAVIGGYVYRGGAIPNLSGCYVFGDFGSTRSVWSLAPASPAVRNTLLSGVANLTTFGEDATGELYFASGSSIQRLVRNPAPVPASNSLQLTAALVCFLALGSASLWRMRRGKGVLFSFGRLQRGRDSRN